MIPRKVGEVCYVMWVPAPPMTELERATRVREGCHHDAHSDLIECDHEGNPLAKPEAMV